MSDQCKNCVVRGNIDSCLNTECGHHENWIAEQHNKRYSKLKEVAIAMLEWIDAVPDDVQLPAMPGFDRDWAEEILDR